MQSDEVDKVFGLEMGAEDYLTNGGQVAAENLSPGARFTIRRPPYETGRQARTLPASSPVAYLVPSANLPPD